MITNFTSAKRYRLIPDPCSTDVRNQRVNNQELGIRNQEFEITEFPTFSPQPPPHGKAYSRYR